jgi:hypothetical protein
MSAQFPEAPPNPAFDRSAKQLRCLVPVALRAPTPGQRKR